MKKITAILLLLTVAAFLAPAQTNTTSTTPDTPPVPQWARDIRRWEIVLFGSFPFSMFTVTTVMDLVRWNNANGMSFDDMRYAPWPLKSTGFVPMTNEEQVQTITIAVGVSAAVAFADMVIVQVKRHKARRRAEALPVGTAIITRTPLPNDAEDSEAIPESPEEQPEQEP
jgi:hypothetical protein